jgi:hypothetical protein
MTRQAFSPDGPSIVTIATVEARPERAELAEAFHEERTMEQDFHVFEYRMQGERFVFQAQGPHDAANHQKYALIHFKEALGRRFSETALEGPFARDREAVSDSRAQPF